MTSETVQIGAIGAGYWGPNLIRNFADLPDSDLVALADLDEGRLRHMAAKYSSIKHPVRDYRELFDLGLDAVVVATPPETHFAIARDCMEAGLHVLVEKPLATTSAHAQEMVRVAEQTGRILMVGHTFEYNPAVRALKQLIDDGELGSIHYIDAVRVGLGLFHPSVNVAWDLGPHDISILIALLGERPATVSAHGVGCVQRDVEDIVYITLTFPSGILAHLRLSWLDPSKVRRITVVGNRKMAVYDDVETEKLRLYDKGVEAIRRTETFGEFQFAYRYGSIVSPYIHFDEPVRVECQHFLDSVRSGTRPRSDGYSGLRVVEVVEAIQRSLKDGGAQVDVEYSLIDLAAIDAAQLEPAPTIADGHTGSVRLAAQA